MARVTLIFGILLSVLGIASYVLTGMTSITALIPTFFGILLILFGVLAFEEKRRKLSMHIAMVIALVGVLGSFSGIIRVITILSGGEVIRPVASYMQAVMALLLMVYLVFGIKSFIDARRN